MSRIHLSESNLRLLLVLDAVLAEGSVTRAAGRLGLTQPAVSHALRRLRELYGDPLLVRGRAGLLPTPLAESMIPRIRLGLTELERVLARDLDFDPATSRRAFSVATVDHPVITALPALLARLRAEAPGVDIRVRGITPGLAQALESGRLDTVLAGGEVEEQLALDRGLQRSRIVSEPFLCIARAGHPAIGEVLDLDTFLALPQVLVSTGGRDSGMVDAVLAGRGLQRRVLATVPNFAGAPHLVAASDLLATVPRAIAEYGATLLGLRVLPPPLPLPRGDAYLWWHERVQKDPGHAWWRRLLLDAFAPYRRD
ncbi:LysR family transcriptional regulator [Roseomonas sp. BN140053]|uniref:LysR family transcriptional regulator n=1 Tax=Roseomonas sp. BN140053 TaxID=3391898 RepID=UPI0039E93577